MSIQPNLGLSGTVRQQTGMTLVEVLVAMAVAFFLMAGILQLFSNTRQTYRATEAMSRIQESGRFAIGYMARDLRQSGYKGVCLQSVELNNMLNDASSVYSDDRFDLTDPLRGWDGTTEAETSSNRHFDEKTALTNYVADTDVFIIKHAADDPELTLNGSVLSTSDTIPVNETTDDLENALIVISDPYGCDLFQNRAADGGNSLSRDDADTDQGPGNSSGSSLSESYEEDDTVISRFRSRMYFIAENEDGVPGLWVRRFDHGYSKSGQDDEELVPGVADMQVTYGLDTDSDDKLDAYHDASTIESDGTLDWDDVVAVRINLLISSLQDHLTEQSVSLPFQDNSGSQFSAASDDRHIYQIFTTTVSLRNRLP